MGKILASVLATFAATYVTYQWRDYSNYNSCFSTVDKLKASYEQSRPRGSHYQIEEGFARAAGFCGEKKYDAAKGAITRTMMMCRVNRGCSATSS